MLHTQPLDSLEHPLLVPYRTMKAQKDHFDKRVFVAEGEKIVQRLLETNFNVISGVMPEKWLEIFRPLIEPRPETVEVFVADKKRLEELTGFSMYQGVFAAATIPQPADLRAILEKAPRPLLLVALDGVNNGENVGAMIRSFAAFGVQAVLKGENTINPYMRRAVRSSMGNVFYVPVVECYCLAYTIRYLRALGIRIVAAHPHTDRRTITQAQMTGDCCIVLGSEGNGVSPEILETCDEAVAVPMVNKVDSLNVGSAAALFCYEAARQRGIM